MDNNHDPMFWPDGTRRSTNNAFVLGWGDTPHGFHPGYVVVPIKPKPRHKPGGFGSRNGTMHGLGEKTVNWRFGQK